MGKIRALFYKETHPLRRLIDFKTRVAVGAMTTSSVDVVSDLVVRIFENRLEYELRQKDLVIFALLKNKQDVQYTFKPMMIFYERYFGIIITKL